MITNTRLARINANNNNNNDGVVRNTQRELNFVLATESSQKFPSKLSGHLQIIFSEFVNIQKPPFLHSHLYGIANGCSNAELHFAFDPKFECCNPSGHEQRYPRGTNKH